MIKTGLGSQGYQNTRCNKAQANYIVQYTENLISNNNTKEKTLNNILEQCLSEATWKI